MNVLQDTFKKINVKPGLYVYIVANCCLVQWLRQLPLLGFSIQKYARSVVVLPIANLKATANI